MFAHLMDHFVFSAKRLTERTKWIVFYVFVSTLVFMFWWFKGFAFGIDGPINDTWGLKWRKVSLVLTYGSCVDGALTTVTLNDRVGIYITSNIGRLLVFSSACLFGLLIYTMHVDVRCRYYRTFRYTFACSSHSSLDLFERRLPLYSLDEMLSRKLDEHLNPIFSLHVSR